MQTHESMADWINDERLKLKIDDILASMSCPHDFMCVRSGVKALHQSRSIGSYQYLECLEDQESHCRFAVTCGGGSLCTCPLRAYISKNIHD